MSVSVAKIGLHGYGNRYLPCIVIILYVTPISGLLTVKFFPNLDIKLLVRKEVQLTALNASTVPCANEFHV